MLRGRDVRLWPLEHRREQLRELVSTLPDVIRYSETFSVALADLERAVRDYRLEGIVAKRAGSPYHSGERCGDWLKWRANRGQEFVIGGYIPNGDLVDSLVVGYYDGHRLMYAASVHAGLMSSGVHCGRISTSSIDRWRDAHSSICWTVAKGGGAKASRLQRWPLAVGSSR